MIQIIVAPPVLAELPISRSECWQVLEQLISRWYSPLTSTDGYERSRIQAAEDGLGVKFPAALHEWLCLCGNRQDIWSQQDDVLKLDAFTIQDKMLLIGVENQGVVLWGIRLCDCDLPDPPVYVDLRDSGGWVLDSMATTEFALSMFFSCVKWSRSLCCYANGSATKEICQFVRQLKSRLPFRPWHWPGFPTDFFGLSDATIELNGDDEHGWLWVSTRTKSAFHEIEEWLRPTEIEWEAWSGEWPDGWGTTPNER